MKRRILILDNLNLIIWTIMKQHILILDNLNLIIWMIMKQHILIVDNLYNNETTYSDTL